MAAKIGCFHFVEGFNDSMWALSNALDQHGDISGSLIVLPEAFKNGKDYYGEPRGRPNLSCGTALNHISSIALGRKTAL